MEEKVVALLKKPIRSFRKVQYLYFEEYYNKFLGYLEWDAEKGSPIRTIGVNEPFCFRGEKIPTSNYSILKNTTFFYVESMNISIFNAVSRELRKEQIIILKFLESLGFSFSFQYQYYKNVEKLDFPFFNQYNINQIFFLKNINLRDFIYEFKLSNKLKILFDNILKINLEDFSLKNLRRLLNSPHYFNYNKVYNELIKVFLIRVNSHSFFKTLFSKNFSDEELEKYAQFIMNDFSNYKFRHSKILRNLNLLSEFFEIKPILRGISNWLEKIKRKIKKIFSAPDYSEIIIKELEERAKWTEFENISEIYIRDLSCLPYKVSCSYEDPCPYNDNCNHYFI
ncbi:MAG: hypothetical protein ACTSQP_21215 [Promethearchaeota archaeon]